jgi:hypothetical protein
MLGDCPKRGIHRRSQFNQGDLGVVFVEQIIVDG